MEEREKERGNEKRNRSRVCPRVFVGDRESESESVRERGWDETKAYFSHSAFSLHSPISHPNQMIVSRAASLDGIDRKRIWWFKTIFAFVSDETFLCFRAKKDFGFFLSSWLFPIGLLRLKWTERLIWLLVPLNVNVGLSLSLSHTHTMPLACFLLFFQFCSHQNWMGLFNY